MAKEEFKQYLASIECSSEDKRYCMNFCKKTEYLDYLKQTAASELHCNINTGYGNINSKICFIFKNEKTFTLLKPLIKDILDKFNISFWNVYVTFINKTEIEYKKKYSYLSNELIAVSPLIIFAVDCNTDVYNSIVGDETHPGVKIEKYFNISSIDLGSSEESVRKDLWNAFRFLMNYKERE